MLRRALNEAGFKNTKIIAKDAITDMNICWDLAKDPEYGKVVDIIGLHYPNDYSYQFAWDQCRSLGKPIWSEGVVLRFEN
jgi:hypothetical protein